MVQQIDLCKFQPKQAYALASVASCRWRNTHVAKDSRVV